MSVGCHQTWCVHCYCGDMVLDCRRANFVICDSYMLATRQCFYFRAVTKISIKGFLLNLECALIFWISAFTLLKGKFRPFLTDLSASSASVFFSQDSNLSKSQWIFTKFYMCIYIVEICFGITHWQISSFLTDFSAHDIIMAGY